MPVRLLVVSVPLLLASGRVNTAAVVGKIAQNGTGGWNQPPFPYPGVSTELQEQRMDNRDWLKQLLMVGVGTTSMVADKLREVSDEWVKDGKINPEQAQGFVDDMVQQIKSEQGNFEVNMERQLRHLLQELGVPRQTEVDELRGRIDRLERQVRDLENKLWR
jgi:polyhydroxyalkanoate synthesis regulator phasin